MWEMWTGWAKLHILFNGKVPIRMDTAGNIRLWKAAYASQIFKYICFWEGKSFSLARKQHCNIPLQIMLHTTTILTKVNDGIFAITVLLTYIQVLLGCDAILLHQ
jgi:hypothetical protein